MLVISQATDSQTRRHMGIKDVEYIVLSDGRTGEGTRKRESWLDIFRRWIVECPQCAEVWLVVGARDNDSHVCKECGHSFAIRFSSAPGESKSMPVVAASEQL